MEENTRRDEDKPKRPPHDPYTPKNLLYKKSIIQIIDYTRNVFDNNWSYSRKKEFFQELHRQATEMNVTYFLKRLEEELGHHDLYHKILFDRGSSKK